jgi:vacuolar protein sorting-associated protein 72
MSEGMTEKKAMSSSGSLIRYSSRRGTCDTITFTDVDAMPEILVGAKVPVIRDNKCCITGFPAKYRDPSTNLLYANLEAYRELKKRYHI